MTAELSTSSAVPGGGWAGRSSRCDIPAARTISWPLATPMRTPAAHSTQAKAATRG